MTPHASFHNNGDTVRWSMDYRFYSPDKPNNLDEVSTDHSEQAKPLNERAVLACSFPSADFVLVDRSSPEREVTDGAGMITARERFEERRMGQAAYKLYMDSGRRPARWMDAAKHPSHVPGQSIRGEHWAVQSDPREWSPTKSVATAKL